MSQKTLYVSNLAWAIRERELRQAFEPYGPIIRVEVMMNDDKRSRGFGFVEFASTEQAARALEKLQQADLSGRPMKLAFAQPRRPLNGRT